MAGSKTPLDELGFVELYDGGYRHFCCKVRSDRSFNNPIALSPQNVATSIRNALKSAQVEEEGGKVDFLPLDKLHHIINKPNVLQLLNRLRSCRQMSTGERERLASSICKVDNTDGCSYRKVVASLIEIEHEDDIPTMVREEFRDSCLPMQHDPEYKIMKHQKTGQKCQTMASWSEEERKKFCRASIKYNVPFFMRPESRGIYHYVFHDPTTLPFIQKDPRYREDTKGFRKPIKEVHTGGYSQVRRVKIHPSHHRFSDYGIQSSDNNFAIKSISASKRTDFQREVSVLLRFTHRRNEQLVKLLATYEVRSGKDTSYHLIFPWADRSVKALWKEFPLPDRTDTSYLQWIASQSVAIVKSLTFIHEEYASELDPRHRERWGRHGDIKPANFLVYDHSQTNPLGLIFMADFGLSRFHRQESRSMVRPGAKSLSYRAPENDMKEGSLSRKSDIWSLGVFFLEFVTWYLKGWGAVRNDFRKRRQKMNPAEYEPDAFFCIEHAGGSERVSVNPEVTEWILILHRDSGCTRFMHDFLDLIAKKMLDPSRESRIGAKDLHTRLKAMYESVEKDPGYCTQPCVCEKEDA
ncbi:hypothetical protein AK830_g10667 [Neonectria ditissima]|uniref:Protein kinase domain-containing protein n=1 Tax=Neonectria ditissima TaxID=78410 RepID=A0A0P7B357_9HYPO|nr:hypothetical protein AK830_g10667 [Neonectria ditissima]